MFPRGAAYDIRESLSISKMSDNEWRMSGDTNRKRNGKRNVTHITSRFRPIVIRHPASDIQHQMKIDELISCNQCWMLV